MKQAPLHNYFSGSPIRCLIGLLLLFSSGFLNAQPNIILGRPTDNSITLSISFPQTVDYFIEAGTQPGIYTITTATHTNVPDAPDEIDLQSLLTNQQYYYRVQYKPSGSGNYSQSPEYTFHTQRAPGSTYSFTIEADEHLYDKKGVENMYRVTLANQLADHPDFMLSLGDIFGDDHEPLTITSHTLDSLHKQYRPFLGAICHSVPFYVCLGNHEGENDYYYAINPPNNLCVWGTQWRKYYFPNPYPNNFYSGNTGNEPYGIGNPENYYSWKWGDAEFIVLDVYRDECDTSDKPQKWAWSLGLPQYTWLKQTLENSTAKFKFVFAHHIRGQGRGGVTNATQYEWGGYQNTNYTFPQYRPSSQGWDKPIHQLFIDNGVNIFFQGHDHLFAHEILDSITYQEVPMAADSTYEIGMLANADAYVSDTLPGTGHLRVTVTGSCVTVDFVRAYLPADTLSGQHHNGEVAFSYTIGECAPSGISNIEQTNGISIFPNPAKNRVAVTLPAPVTGATFTLYNMVGALVLQSSSNEMDISTLPAGVYQLQVNAPNFNGTKRMIISR